MSKLNQVYDARSDQERMLGIQEATKDGRGLKNTHGLVGSAEWWRRIDTGELRRYVCEGLVVALDGGPMGDWPTMRVQDQATLKVQAWTVRGAIDSSVIGRKARVEFALQEPFDPPRPGYMVKIVIGVWVEQDD